MVEFERYGLVFAAYSYICIYKLKVLTGSDTRGRQWSHCREDVCSSTGSITVLSDFINTSVNKFDRIKIKASRSCSVDES